MNAERFAGRFVVQRRFSSWLGVVWDVYDTEDERVICVSGGKPDSEAKAKELAKEANALHAVRKEVALKD